MTNSETMTRRTRADIAAETREAILNAACEVIADPSAPATSRMAAAAVGKAYLSLEPGETTVSASVTATWQLEV